MTRTAFAAHLATGVCLGIVGVLTTDSFWQAVLLVALLSLAMTFHAIGRADR